MANTARTSTGGRPPRRPALPTRAGAPGFGFFQDVANELRKVVWPTREQTFRLSAVVVAACGAVGVALGLIDYVFSFIMQNFLVPPL